MNLPPADYRCLAILSGHRGALPSPPDSVSDHKYSLANHQVSVCKHQKTSLSGWLPLPLPQLAPSPRFFFLRPHFPAHPRGLLLSIQTPGNL